MFSYPYFLAYILGAQKSRPIETVLFSTHNICFGLEIITLFFCYSLLTKGLICIRKQRISMDKAGYFPK